MEQKRTTRVGIERYSSYSKLIQVTARILSFCSKSPVALSKNALKTPDVESLKQADKFWVQKAQRDLEDPLRNGDFKILNVYKDEIEIIVVGNHVEKWVEISYDK